VPRGLTGWRLFGCQPIPPGLGLAYGLLLRRVEVVEIYVFLVESHSERIDCSVGLAPLWSLIGVSLANLKVQRFERGSSL
jgi:hypothetical protein